MFRCILVNCRLTSDCTSTFVRGVLLYSARTTSTSTFPILRIFEDNAHANKSLCVPRRPERNFTAMQTPAYALVENHFSSFEKRGTMPPVAVCSSETLFFVSSLR